VKRRLEILGSQEFKPGVFPVFPGNFLTHLSVPLKRSGSRPLLPPGQYPVPPTPTPHPVWEKWGGTGIVVLLGFFAFGISYYLTRLGELPGERPKGMVWLPPGEFLMGSGFADANRNEQPVRKIQVDGFWMDEHEVTNEQFAHFVQETGYLTTAQKKPIWVALSQYLPPNAAKPSEDQLVPGSLVFTPPPGPVPLEDSRQWWKWVPGSDWQHPEGPDSDLAGRENHPVVHVSWDDATAYAKWAHKRLPTEAEWEYAARGGQASKKFTWGDSPAKENKPLANIWQGTFPNQNTAKDGFERTAPVKFYPPNRYGLYDMAGNVWEWCADLYRADEYARTSPEGAGMVLLVNPAGPTDSWDPNEPFGKRYVTRGGSFLCHVSYCESYRPAARRGTPSDTGMSHIGFRCVQDAKPAQEAQRAESKD